MNDILSEGNDPQMHVLYNSKILKIDNNGGLIYYDSYIEPGLGILPDKIKDVKFIKEKEIDESESYFDSAMNNLKNNYLERYGN